MASYLTCAPSQFCCGMQELGNFNYVDPPGGKRMTHYHKVGGSWKSQPNAEPTTKEEVMATIARYTNGGIIATTGAGQEYMDPVLEECGFKCVTVFRNPGHANTAVKIWTKVLNEYVPDPPAKEKTGAEACPCCEEVLG